MEDLRRRVQRDPASIAFAQLAEECRRAGQFEESIDICRAGLVIHPGYLSARVTLGRALVELDQLDDALAELEHVLASAPENLAAIRGVAEIHHRRGNLGDALHHYRAALALARNDPDLQETVSDLAKKVEPAKPPALDGLSLEQVTRELFVNSPPPPALAPQPPASPAAVPPPPAPALSVGITETSEAITETPIATASLPAEPPDTRAVATIAALEQWLAAIHVARTHQRT